MLIKIKHWSDMLTEKEQRRSKVYREGSKFVYDSGDLPDGLSASIGSVLCLQKPYGLSAPQMPGNAEDWVVIGGGSGEGGGTPLVIDSSLSGTSTHPVQNKAVKVALDGKMDASQAFKTVNGQSIKGSGNISIPECQCEVPFTTALLNKLNALPTISISGNIITINGTDYELTPASAPVTQYAITTAVNDSKMGSVTGSGNYNSGTTVTLVATANSGYHFVSWQDGVTNATRTVTVTGNATYTATFAADTPAPSSEKDYYVGWTTGSKSDFAALTDAQVEALATGYTTAQQNPYTGQFGQNPIFFLLYKSATPPQSVVLTSAGQSMTQDIVNDNTCPHNDVTIDGTTYKVFGIRLSSGYDASDSMTITF